MEITTGQQLHDRTLNWFDATGALVIGDRRNAAHVRAWRAAWAIAGKESTVKQSVNLIRLGFFLGLGFGLGFCPAVLVSVYIFGVLEIVLEVLFGIKI